MNRELVDKDCSKTGTKQCDFLDRVETARELVDRNFVPVSMNWDQAWTGGQERFVPVKFKTTILFYNQAKPS